METLGRLIGDADRFILDCWGKASHLHFAGDLTTLVSLSEIETVAATALWPDVLLASEGREIDPVKFTRKENLTGQLRIDLAAVKAMYNDGATIHVSRLESRHTKISDVAYSLQQELGVPVAVDAFITPPRSRGFGRHRDTDDVIVVQFAGEKTWRLGDEDSRDATRNTGGEVVLKPGSVLYVPRGLHHDTWTEGWSSAHLAIGLHGPTWGETAIGPLARSAPPPRVSAELRRTMVSQLAAELSVDLLASWNINELPALVDTGVALEGLFALERGGTRYLVCTELTAKAEVTIDAERARLVTPRCSVGGPVWLAETFDYIAGCPPSFSPDDLERFLDPESARVLLRLLLSEGLIYEER